jgi:serine/threonine-protein kinase
VSRLKAPPVPPEATEALKDPLRVLDHYVLVSLLGRGGMAEVWKAWDRSLGRWVAVKYLRPDIGHPTQRIEREGRMAGALSHPGIISIFERGVHGARPYLVMPYVEGTPPGAPLPPREAARIAWEVAGALAHAHERGIIHRDVKPANILLAAGGHVVLADFGLAIPDDTATSRWAISGTPEYASPEQVRGDQLDGRTDIYSLGATLYHLLSGKPPYGGAGPEEIAAKILRGEREPLRGAPRALSAAVERAMAMERERRYPDVGEFRSDLWKYLEGTRQGFRLRPALLAALALAAVLPWGVTFHLLSLSQAGRDRGELLRALRDGERLLARAEQSRADPQATREEVAAAARRALPYFNEALQWAGGADAEASAGIGRCWELVGEEALAEEAFLRAAEHPSGRDGLVRLWVRRHLEGRRDRDWRALALSKLDRTGPLRDFLEGRVEAAAGAAPPDRYDDLLLLVHGVASIQGGRWDEALRSLDQGRRIRRGDPLFSYYRGVALQGKGDLSGAGEAFREALATCPRTWALAPEAQTRLSGLR